MMTSWFRFKISGLDNPPSPTAVFGPPSATEEGGGKSQFANISSQCDMSPSYHEYLQQRRETELCMRVVKCRDSVTYHERKSERISRLVLRRDGNPKAAHWFEASCSYSGITARSEGRLLGVSGIRRYGPLCVSDQRELVVESKRRRSRLLKGDLQISLPNRIASRKIAHEYKKTPDCEVYVWFVCDEQTVRYQWLTELRDAVSVGAGREYYIRKSSTTSSRVCGSGGGQTYMTYEINNKTYDQ